MTASREPLLTRPFVALFVAALTFFVAGGVVLPVATRFAHGPLGADALGVGIGLGAFSVAALLVRPVVGAITDRFGRKPALLTGAALTIVALIAHLAVTSLPGFIVVRAAFGIGEGFFFVAALAAVTDLAPASRRGEAVNVGSLAVYLGLGIGPVIGETVLSIGGYPMVWLAAAGLAVVALGCSLVVPETSPAVLAARAAAAAASEAGRPDPRIRPPRTRLIHPAGLLPGVLILCGTWGMAGFFAFVPLYVPSLGLDVASVALALYALIVIGLRIVFVTLPDRLGAARLAGAALVVETIGLTVIGVVVSPVGLYVGTAVFATGVAFMFPALITVAVDRVPETERGSAVGTAGAFFDVSFGLAPAMLGSVADAQGYPAVFLVGAAVAIGGAVLLAARRSSLVRPPLPV